MKREQKKQIMKGRSAIALSAAGLIASFLFGACSDGDSAGDDFSKGGGNGGPGGEAGAGVTGGTTGSGGTNVIGGNSGTSGTAGTSNVGGEDTGGTTGTGGGGTGGGGGGPVICLPSGEACDGGPDCCSFSCIDGECSAGQCVADGEACTANEECCGGTCTNDVCAPLNGDCRTSGNPCDSPSQCCSKYCVDNLCSPTPSYCLQLGDTCRADNECCGGKCEIADGATLGLCRVAEATGGGGCLSAGEVCSDGAVYDPAVPLPTCGGECCSRACFPYAGSGVLVCQPPSGCHPTGELCRENTDCCGSEGLPDGDLAQAECSKPNPDDTIGRCDNGNRCAPAGGICRLDEVQCNATARCCAGNVHQEMVCRQDSLGIPRCLAADIDCTDPESLIGIACASSADCCNLPCLPNPGGDPPFVCGGMCVPAGGTCTTTADCCRGLPCITLPGATSGTCGDTGTGGTGGTGGMGGTDSGGTNSGGTDSGGTAGMGGTGGYTGGTGGMCAAYGQSCDTSADCCNMVPCTNGFCLDDPR